MAKHLTNVTGVQIPAPMTGEGEVNSIDYVVTMAPVSRWDVKTAYARYMHISEIVLGFRIKSCKK